MLKIDYYLISYILRQRLDHWLELAFENDPILGSVRAHCSPHAKVRVLADVAEEQPRTAVYDVPQSGCETVIAAPPSDFDEFVRWIDDVTEAIYRAVVRRFRTDLLHPTQSDFVGLSGLLPSVHGERCVGGIDENVVRGWRSVVEAGKPSVAPGKALAALAAACTKGGRWPEVMLVGRNILGEYFDQSRPRIVYVHQNRPTQIPFGRSVLVPGYSSDPNAAYALHTGDFMLQRGPLQVVVEPLSVGDSPLRINVQRRHQLIATRRFRSGQFSRAAA